MFQSVCIALGPINGYSSVYQGTFTTQWTCTGRWQSPDQRAWNLGQSGNNMDTVLLYLLGLLVLLGLEISVFFLFAAPKLSQFVATLVRATIE